MIQYMGYSFNNREEVETYLKNSAVNAYERAIALFNQNPTMEAECYCSEKAEILVNRFGFTWEQVEKIENDFYRKEITNGR